MTRLIEAAALALILAGCGEVRTVYLCPTLPEPARPAVPNVGLSHCCQAEPCPGEVPLDVARGCLGDEQASKLHEREVRLVEYAEDLEVIITTHNANCAKDYQQ